MLYLSQFVFQSILFSKKKEHAGDSWHPPVPGGEGAAVLPPVASAALTSPSLGAPPHTGLQAAPAQEGAGAGQPLSSAVGGKAGLAGAASRGVPVHREG